MVCVRCLYSIQVVVFSDLLFGGVMITTKQKLDEQLPQGSSREILDELTSVLSELSKLRMEAVRGRQVIYNLEKRAFELETRYQASLDRCDCSLNHDALET